MKVDSAPIETVDIKGRRKIKTLLALSFVAVVVLGVTASAEYFRTQPQPTTPVVAPNRYAREMFRYRLEVATENAVKYLTSEPVLASGERFRFTFTPRVDGYIYILGPGEDNRLTLFLGNQPFSEAGIESNRLIVEARFNFPAFSAPSNWLVLDKTTGIDRWIVIFSKEKLSTYEFLDKNSGYLLNSDDLGQLEKLRKQSVKFHSLPREVDGSYLSLLQADTNGSGLLLIDIPTEHR